MTTLTATSIGVTLALSVLALTYTQMTHAEPSAKTVQLQFATSAGFHSTWSKVSTSPSTTVFAVIAQHYNEPHRKYHNLSHIDFCLAELSKMQVDDPSRSQIELALWFHDIIYDPHAKDNERKSAAVFRKFALEGQLPDPFIETVVTMIEATEKHQVPPEQDHFATRLFLDLDLAILGADENIFWTYDRAIRAEYKWVPKTFYRSQRSKILKSFLERPTIYFTTEFQKLYEARARHNLNQSIDRLKK